MQNKPDDDEPRTWFEMERRRLLNPGEDKSAPKVPWLPASSPWAADVVGVEPLKVILRRLAAFMRAKGKHRRRPRRTAK
jgi:hypothetical protein